MSVSKLCAHDCCSHCRIAGEQPVTAGVYRSLGNKVTNATAGYKGNVGTKRSEVVEYHNYGIGY